MLDPGDVVVVRSPGALGAKVWPAVVVSSSTYHSSRPDVILGLLTTQVVKAVSSSDYRLTDWRSAGLHRPSAFRAYLVTENQQNVTRVGRLSSNEWCGVQTALRAALELP